jgi:hypothetical protein
MPTARYNVNQYALESILSWVQSGEIAIPEIQRPFVWDSTKVRDLMDSLYQGYPIGYLIAWRNPSVRLKDGSQSDGKKVLIDGQQRVTALTAAVLGQYVINKSYQRVKIKIAFHPLREQFEVFNTAIERDKAWIPDIGPIVSGQERISRVIRVYQDANPEASEDQVEDAVENLRQMMKMQIGLIELKHDLDIETVTEIFIRINSKGVVLSNADFAMSKIAASEQYQGPILRKAIDYFCHLAVAPEFYQQIVENDPDFAATDYFRKMAWLRHENDDLYDPSYNDLLRVAFTSEFSRGRISDLVSLLSGRNFETRTFEADIAAESFASLQRGVMNFINETNFKRFVMIIHSAGFITSRLVRSQNALNFAYILFLRLRSLSYDANHIEQLVRKWFVMSILTGRYSGSSETAMDMDIKRISEMGVEAYLKDLEAAILSDAFWQEGLVQDLNTSVSSNPVFQVFLASQVRMGDKGFLSRDISIKELINFRGDIHHIFPRNYLKKQGLTRGRYNQVANYVYMQSEINIKVGNRAPHVYFAELIKQCETGNLVYGGIDNLEALKGNLAQHCIPQAIFDMSIDHYDDFLTQRRRLMAHKLRTYYEGL